MERKHEKKSFLQIVKEAVRSKDTALFPWLKTGIFLAGFTCGIFIMLMIISIPSFNFFTRDNSETSQVTLCIQKGGWFDTENQRCITKTEDTGQACDSNNDCDGWCLAKEDAEIGSQGVGTCSEIFRPHGCITYIDDGMVNEICIPE